MISHQASGQSLVAKWTCSSPNCLSLLSSLNNLEQSAVAALPRTKPSCAGWRKIMKNGSLEIHEKMSSYSQISQCRVHIYESLINNYNLRLYYAVIAYSRAWIIYTILHQASSQSLVAKWTCSSPNCLVSLLSSPNHNILTVCHRSLATKLSLHVSFEGDHGRWDSWDSYFQILHTYY